jgi:hypothetical protein
MLADFILPCLPLIKNFYYNIQLYFILLHGERHKLSSALLAKLKQRFIKIRCYLALSMIQVT